jgi:hypothetical protein
MAYPLGELSDVISPCNECGKNIVISLVGGVWKAIAGISRFVAIWRMLTSAVLGRDVWVDGAR